MKNSVNKEVKEIGIKSIFSFAVNALLIFFLIILGIETIKIGQLLFGLLYFVLSILVLVPHHFLRVTHALKVVIIVVLFVVVAGISGSGKPPTEQKYEHFGLGGEFNLTFGNNTFSMMVKEAQRDYKFGSSEKEVPTTSGIFLNIKADIVNLGSEAVDFKFGKTPELKDNQNRLYTLYATSMPVGGKLQPSVAKEVSYIFEIPKEASGLKFIIRDKTDVAKSVDLKR